MTRRLVSLAVSLSASMVALPAAWAQSRPVELGFDAMLAHYSIVYSSSTVPLPPRSYTALQFPVGGIRAAFPVADRLALEPVLSFGFQTGGGSTSTGGTLDVGAPYLFSADRRATQVFVRPFVGISYGAAKYTLPSGSTTSSTQHQWSGGLGLGVKIPAGERFATRLEARYRRLGAQGPVDHMNVMSGLAGFSYYTK